MLKAIIFDMDGVIVNIPVWKAFNKILKKRYNIEVSSTDIKDRYIGRSLQDQLQMIQKDYDIEESIDVDKFSQKATKVQLNLIKDMKLDPDLERLINNLKKENIKIILATSSHRYRAKKILNLLGIYDKFDAITTADDVENHKPHPDVFLKSIKDIKAEPRNCIVFEDAENWIKGAKKAKMKTIGVLNKNNNKKYLQNADKIIDNFSQIKINDLKELI